MMQPWSIIIKDLYLKSKHMKNLLLYIIIFLLLLSFSGVVYLGSMYYPKITITFLIVLFFLFIIYAIKINYDDCKDF
jgi:hypothetical protein